MDLAVARRDVRALLGEPHTIKFSDNDLNDMLDEGQIEVATLTLGHHKRTAFTSVDATLALQDGVREYTIAGTVGQAGLGITDCIRVLHIFLDGQSLPLWTPAMVSRNDARSSAGGIIRYWYQFAGRVGFVPYPTSTFIDDTDTDWSIEVVYAALPAAWTTGDGSLPSGFDELPTLFALERCMVIRRRWADADAIFMQYAALVDYYRTLSLLQAATPQMALMAPKRARRPEEPRAGGPQ